MSSKRNNGFESTEWALTLDEGNTLCRGLDKVEQWVQEWDGVEAPFALWSDATETHSYVRKVEITGRSVRFDSTGTPFIRARVTFADPEVGTVGANLIKVGGKYFTADEVELAA